MRRMLLAAGLSAAMALPLAAEAQETASARMMNAEGEEIGTVTLTATASGLVHILAEVADLTPGPHGFHIHETGQCDPESGFESAGGHYAGDKEHGVLVEGGPHPGDFPNVNVGQNGVLKAEFFTDRLSLGGEGENPLMDEDGSAVMIHSGRTTTPVSRPATPATASPAASSSRGGTQAARSPNVRATAS